MVLTTQGTLLEWPFRLLEMDVFSSTIDLCQMMYWSIMDLEAIREKDKKMFYLESTLYNDISVLL